MRHVLVAVLAAGCSGKPSEAPPPAPPASDHACADATTKLSAWLRSLAAEGQNPLMLDDIKLAKLPGEQARTIPPMPTVFVTPREVTFQGQLLTMLPITDHGRAITDRLAEAKVTDALFIVDASVPWVDVSATVMAVAAAKTTHVTFAFEAGVPGKTARPPPSMVDKELDDLAKPPDPEAPVPKLYAPNDPKRPPSMPDKVFKDCPTVRPLFGKIGAAETSTEKDRLIYEDFPKAIAACGCKVEIASVQRLFWSWYRRDSTPQTLAIAVELAADKGTKVTMPPTTPWSAAAKAVVDAAKAGQPITLE